MMSPSTLPATVSNPMILRWTIGCIAGLLIIAVTSPCFVRSYTPRVVQPQRNALTLQPGAEYRWRSEGYANTQIGPLGMPGASPPLPLNPSTVHLALWGDSQAEGVCVADDQKIAAQTHHLSAERIDVLPFARSGDDCNDWLPQITSLQRSSIKLDAHVFLLVEWSDWCQPVRQPSSITDQQFDWVAEQLPAFLIQATRNVLTTGTDNQFRRLRFRPGPITSNSSATAVAPAAVTEQPDQWTSRVAMLAVQLARLKHQTRLPCIFLYAPLSPAIINGDILWDDPDDDLFQAMQSIAAELGFDVVDLRHQMQQSVRTGKQWPRGFHNGQFGVGHYNAVGYRIISAALAAHPRLDALPLTSTANTVTAER
ncbi:hypothetical protein NHH03_04300 [Stieleria sp. TO1_6]|uniref:hypothetical protein n=1 Tax=Stieleria tagensis TaxID=2956795 RepID=UPI00209B6868|nr:hypothetical protein [Stieleria tagensis]MCO8120948.1 hypothetical protein [Stieleria tagensis]